MMIEWTNTFRQDYDLDWAEETFYDLLMKYPNKDPNSLIYEAIERTFYFEDGCEYIDYSEAIEIAAKALRKRIGGVQMEMDLLPFPTL